MRTEKSRIIRDQKFTQYMKELESIQKQIKSLRKRAEKDGFTLRIVATSDVAYIQDGSLVHSSLKA